eukprot:2544123-Prymnesium_polylepis.3
MCGGGSCARVLSGRVSSRNFTSFYWWGWTFPKHVNRAAAYSDRRAAPHGHMMPPQPRRPAAQRHAAALLT